MSARSIQEITSTPIAISYTQIGKEAWESCKDQIVPLAIGVIAWSFAVGFSYLLSMILIGIPVLCVLAAGPVIVGHHLASGKEVSIGTWFGGFKKLVPITLTVLVGGIAVGIATMVAMIPMFVGLMLPLFVVSLVAQPLIAVAMYLVLDRDMAFADAYKEGFEVVKAHVLDFLAMSSAVGMVAALGSGVWGIGSLITLPVALMMSGVFMRNLLGDGGGLDAID
jgi:hypothetical protein